MTGPMPYLLRTRVDALLDQGEQALAGARVALPPAGADKIIKPPPDPRQSPDERRMTAGEKALGAVVLVAAAALGQTGWSGGDLPDRALGGYRVRGTSESIGARLFKRLRRTSGTTYVIVTDQRLAVAYEQSVKSGTPLTPLADVPRSEIVAARRRGRLGARGRVELYFRDSSMLAIMTGILSTRRARLLLSALALPKRPA